MKNLFRSVFMLIAVYAMVSCSSDDDSGNGGGTTFTLDGENYDMSLFQGHGSSLQIVNIGAEENMSTGQITLIGLNGMKQGTLQFVVTFNTDEGISGTYHAGDIDEVGTYDSESANYYTSEIVDGSQEIHLGEGGEGTFKITKNSENNYSVEFEITYDDGKISKGNFTKDFFVQEVGF